VSISFDSGDPVTMAEQRQIPGIMDEMAKMMEAIKKTSLKTMASVLIWNDNYDKLEEVCKKAVNMGYDFVSLNYPTFSKSQVYPLGGEGISLSRDKVIKGLEDAIRLKKEGKYPIENLPASMENIIAYLKEPSSAKFCCYGGKRVAFVDWFFDVRPCMQLPDKLGNILTMTEKDFKVINTAFHGGCNNCNMSWYRDFSMYYHGLRSLPVFCQSMKGSSKILAEK
jgi:MoaA/NifB/PqqE/SkfB family radical SAM enzyme